MNSTASDRHFTSTNVALCAFLITRGHKLHKVVSVDGERASFRFAFSGELDMDRTAFFSGALVPAQAYAIALRDAKGSAKRAVDERRSRFGYQNDHFNRPARARRAPSHTFSHARE